MWDKQNEFVFSKRVKAGKRTYFIDVKSTKKEDYFITITESTRKGNNDNNFIKQKIFLYKEDFNKFERGLLEAIDYVKQELMPDYDFDKFDRPDEEEPPRYGPKGGSSSSDPASHRDAFNEPRSFSDDERAFPRRNLDDEETDW